VRGSVEGDVRLTRANRVGEDGWTVCWVNDLETEPPGERATAAGRLRHHDPHCTTVTGRDRNHQADRTTAEHDDGIPDA
jgi:hypothetical protein